MTKRTLPLAERERPGSRPGVVPAHAGSHRHLLVSMALASSFVGVALPGAAASGPGADPLPPGLRPAYIEQRERVSFDEVVVRFLPDAGARVRGGQLVSTTGSDLSNVAAIVASFDGLLEPRFPQGEQALDALRARGEAAARRALADLNLFATVRLPHETEETSAIARLDDILGQLNGSGPVAEAWPAPLLEPASRVLAASVLAAPASAAHSWVDADSRSSARGDSSATPDFSPQQGYLYESPVGVNAPTAWTYPGGLGETVDMIDIEWGWLFAHEDLKDPFHATGEYGGDDHGTAVLGEIAGQHNGYGVNGISPEVRIGGISLNTYSIAGAITEAATVLDPGDVFLMEVQCGGPESWMPCEWWSDVYAAIEVATAAGVICVEAGGNGTVNLDDALYGSLFDKRVRDSNAIMVGAGTPTGLNAEGFSNFGSRVDLQGWGSSIVTTCCGDLQGGDPEVRYTAGFNGTSGASPIVVGSICSLQGQARALFGTSLTPDLAEEILSATGTPWTGDRQIGERPDLAAARDRLVLGSGDLSILVRDGDTLEPLPGMVIQFVETGRLALAGPDGRTQMQVSATSFTIRVEGDFYYPAVDVPYTMNAGEEDSLTIELFRAPMGSIEGRVKNTTGAGIPNATVALPNTPISPVTTGPTGDYAIAGIPENTGYEALAYGVPTYGVDYASLDVQGSAATGWNPVLVGATTFEANNGGYVPINEWEWGTPTYPILDPPPTFSGTKVWGTNLDGPYGDVEIYILTSPVFDVREATQLFLSFHHWYWIDPDDGAQLQVWNEDTSRWVVVPPIGGYPDQSIQVLNFTGGYNGHTTEGYLPAIFDLSDWMGGDLQFRFYFRSNISGHKLGWYIDDVALDTGQGGTVSVDELPPDGTPFLRLVSIGPNPAANTSSIRFSLGSASAVELAIVDAAGQRVRTERTTLVAGTHELGWNGITENGAAVPTGVYYYRLRAGSDEVTGRWVRIR